jgi:16S rRNA processing protein RimM
MKKIVIAKILTSHGVKGFVKLESYTENPKEVFQYSDNLFDKNNKKMTLKFIGTVKSNIFIVDVNGINSPEMAKTYRNTEIYIDIGLLPQTKEGEYYYNDIVGLTTKSVDGKYIGKIVSINDFGAGFVVEIKWEGEKMEESLPFNQNYFKETNIKENYTIVDRPEYV